MTQTFFCLAAAVALVFFPRSRGEASDSFIDNNPELGAYQNEGNCFPLQDAWYVMYRNYKEDPFFGGDAKCIIIWEEGPFVDNEGIFKAHYGVDGSAPDEKLFSHLCRNATATLLSSPGYTVKNVIHAEALDGSGLNFNLTAVYADCSRCKVFRHSYIQNGKGCSLWQPKKALAEDITCCKFVYDLICGVSPKYQIYDDC